MSAIVDQISIEQPPEVVFNFVTTFGTWPRWYPITKSVEGVTRRPSDPGDICKEHVRMLGVPLTFYWTTKQKDFPKTFRFEGTSSVGGKAKIMYTFTPEGNETLFRRELDYHQTNLIMRFLDWLFLRLLVVRASTQALINLKAILEHSEDQNLVD